MAITKKKVSAKSRKRLPAGVDLLEHYKKTPYSVGKMLPTTTKKKVDTYESYFPKEGTCLDYNISQTVLRMDAGNTKINIKETRATYVPMPLEMQKNQKRLQKARGMKYGHGYPAQWVFVDEIWLDEQNALQELYMQELKKFIKRRKKADVERGRGTHNRIQAMVGPEWFQELSPKQMRTVDQLYCCILKDLKDDTIINTQENVGNLGLVLRPNHTHIAAALRHCCNCPVEFLLILYQLINPNRENYSLNDRLLLSAVVHLTMTVTLRELHVRIPSPPRPVKVPEKPPKKAKEQTYISPYLKPYTFEPEKRKFSGVYTNKHVQRPESRYFAYIESLKQERMLIEDILELDISNFDPEEQELLDDWKEAQLVYDELQGDLKVKLLKPTVLKKCTDFETSHDEMLVKSENRGGGDNTKTTSAGGNKSSDKEDKKGTRGDNTKGPKGDGDGKKDGGSEKKKTANGGNKRGSSGGVGSFGMGGRKGSLGNQGNQGRSNGKEEDEFILPPLANLDEVDRLGDKCECCQAMENSNICCEHLLLKPCEECARMCKRACDCRESSKRYTTPKCTMCLEKQQRKNAQKWVGGLKMTSKDRTMPIISGIVPQKTCSCVEGYKNKIIAAAGRNRIQCDRARFVIGGITMTKDGPVYIISTALGKRKPRNLKPLEPPKRVCRGIEEDEEQKPKRWPRDPYECTCRKCRNKEDSSDEEDECPNKRPKQNLCKKCQEGCKYTCSCVEDHRNKVIAAAARNRIQCHGARLVIGGISMTKNGPVYIISAALGEIKPKNITPKRSYKRTCKICGNKEESSEEEEEEEIVMNDECGVNCRECPCKKHKKCLCKKCKKVPEFEFSSPCACQDECICKNRSELVTNSKCERCLAQRKLQQVDRIIGGLQQVGSSMVPLVAGTCLQESCDCLQKYKDKLAGISARNKIKSRKAKFVVSGVASTKDGPVYILSTAIGKKPRKKKRTEAVEEVEVKKVEDCVCKIDSSDDENEDDTFKYSSCKCREALKKFLSHKCTCEKCMVRERQKTATFIKGGIKYTESGNVVNILSGIYGQQCNCLEKYLEKIAALDEYRKRIEARYRLMSQDLKFAIGGVVNTPQGPIYIITGMRPPVECECARVLREKAEEQLRLQRAPKMPPTGRIKYEITGVKGMPDGEENVFILSQALNVDDCECMKLFNKFEEAHTSCFKIYEDFLNQIQDSLKEYNTEMEGPKEDAVENIEEVDEDEFVDEEYKPSDEQDYMFDEEPVIESALEPVIEPVIEEVKDEVKITCQPMESSSEESIEVDCTCKEGFTGFESDETVITEEYSVSSSGSSIEAVDALQLKFTESGKIDTSLSDPEIEDATTTDPKADKSKDKVKGGNGKTDKSKADKTKDNSLKEKSLKSKGDNSKDVKLKPDKKEKKIVADKTKVEKSGGEKSDKSTLNKPDADDSKRNSIKTDKEAKEPKQGGTGGSKELKRFLILEKIPSEEKEQQEILEKMLPTLVEDGFPLAKLPDIHKLPHFKLWMQMRCGKFWRQKDRKWYEEFSKIHWCHTDVCYREVARPDLGISKRKAKLMTWKDASFVKSIVADKVGMYYRLVKQQTIEMAREFFPISFDYEFPNKTYRDVFSHTHQQKKRTFWLLE